MRSLDVRPLWKASGILHFTLENSGSPAILPSGSSSEISFGVLHFPPR